MAAGLSVAAASLLCSSVVIVGLGSRERSLVAADTTGETSGPEVAVTITVLTSSSACIAALPTALVVGAASEEDAGTSAEDGATVVSAATATVEATVDGEASTTAPGVDAAPSVPLCASALKTALVVSTDGDVVGLASVTAWMLTCVEVPTRVMTGAARPMVATQSRNANVDSLGNPMFAGARTVLVDTRCAFRKDPERTTEAREKKKTLEGSQYENRRKLKRRLLGVVVDRA